VDLRDERDDLHRRHEFLEDLLRDGSPGERPIVSRAEARPPPCQLRMPYLACVGVVGVRGAVKRLHLGVGSGRWSSLRTMMEMGVPSGSPSNVPERMWQVSLSCAGDDLAFARPAAIEDRPGCRPRSRNARGAAIDDNADAPAWDSPHVVT